MKHMKFFLKNLNKTSELLMNCLEYLQKNLGSTDETNNLWKNF